MSKINITRAVENIRANTTVYSPIIEMIVNAIHAIDATERSDGKVSVRALRSSQLELDGALPDITGFEVEDNGIGFNDTHRESFDTLYTDAKINEGGKGFGRFIGLKYFEDLHVKSVYKDGDGFMCRDFSMGRGNDIIVHERVTPSEIHEIGSVVTLNTLKGRRAYDKRIPTIARHLVERLLPYFITEDYVCPIVVLSEQDGTDAICLNDYFTQGQSAGIQEMALSSNTICLDAHDTSEEFVVRVFKFFAPGSQKSKISLVAHKREVSGSSLDKYVPEFADEFYERDSQGEIDRTRNFIVKAYVFGSYLDRNVSLERGGFEFQLESDLLFGIAQTDIEREAAAIAREAVGDEIALRRERKKDRVQSYVDEEAPWYKSLLSNMDLSGMPYNPTNEEIEARLQNERFTQEVAIKQDVAKILAASTLGDMQDSVQEIVSKISDSSRNELIHYIALRRRIIDIFGKSLEADDTGKYPSEGVVHDIIFPRKGDTEATSFDEQNLWILDERLNFTTYVSSDVPLHGKGTERPDVIAYNRRILFRGDNEPSNPITIIEFKRPQRDDFANRSSPEDPIEQIVRYVNDIRDGKFMTPEGRKILVAPNTPFYGYVVCDLTSKVERWLEFTKDFNAMPDGLGWFGWRSKINLYIEVMSWDKVLKDAKMRNQIFFQKLGI